MFTKDTRYTVHNHIRTARIAHKLTQDELAARAQVTRQTIISIEKGNYVPSVLLALKLADILNKRVEELFTYEEI